MAKRKSTLPIDLSDVAEATGPVGLIPQMLLDLSVHVGNGDWTEVVGSLGVIHQHAAALAGWSLQFRERSIAYCEANGIPLPQPEPEATL